MYAVIECGGKQFKVSEGDVIEVEKINLAPGEKIEVDVLLKVDGDNLVSPDGQKLTASAEIISHGKAKKIVVYKYKPKKNQRKKQGHRQPFTRIKINKIA